MGLGFLAKGPVAVVLPLGSLLIAMSLQLRFWVLTLSEARSLATVLLVITPWHVASYLDQGWAFSRLLSGRLGRFSDTMESHGGSYSYYLLLLPVIVLPFIRWLPATSDMTGGHSFTVTNHWIYFVVLVWTHLCHIFRLETQLRITYSTD